jgi:DNA segregation ATPase FtsK/SpoIIIE-like protein
LILWQHQAAQRLVLRQSTLTDLPLSVELRNAGVVSVVGAASERDALVRAFIYELATFHSPDDLRLVIGADPARPAHWEWAKWLPYTPPLSGSQGGPSLLAWDLDRLGDLLESEIESRRAEQVRRQAPARVSCWVLAPDAYTLPPVPGSAYLKVDAAAPRRFKVASASVPCTPRLRRRPGLP